MVSFFPVNCWLLLVTKFSQGDDNSVPEEKKQVTRKKALSGTYNHFKPIPMGPLSWTFVWMAETKDTQGECVENKKTHLPNPA